VPQARIIEERSESKPSRKKTQGTALSSEAVELSPQNAYIRRLQHQLAERANLVS
jgi:hypothetical protein